MPTPAIFRNAKNKIGKYSDSQIKVRNATSNDPGGPSLHALIEIASLSFNPIILDEMLQILIKRINDDGKNWRHIYKSLKVFEFMAIHGSNYALEFSKRNLHYFESLKSFQHFKDSRECGGIIREAATRVVVLLTNETELQNARNESKNVTEAVSRKNQLTKSGPLNAHSENTLNNLHNHSSQSGNRSHGAHISEDLKKAFPQSAEEEDCQLQVALALSKEEFGGEITSEQPMKKNQPVAASVDDLLMIDFSNMTVSNQQNDLLSGISSAPSGGINMGMSSGFSTGLENNFTGGISSAYPQQGIHQQGMNQQSHQNFSQMQSSSYFNPFDQGFQQDSQFTTGDSRSQQMAIREEVPFSPVVTQRVNNPNDPFFMPQSNNPPLQYPVQNNLYNPGSRQPAPASRLPEITPFNTNKPNEKQDPFDFLNDFINTQDSHRIKETSPKPYNQQTVQESDVNNPFL